MYCQYIFLKLYFLKLNLNWQHTIARQHKKYYNLSILYMRYCNQFIILKAPVLMTIQDETGDLQILQESTILQYPNVCTMIYYLMSLM